MNEGNIIQFISEINEDLAETDMLNGNLDKDSINRLIDTHVCFIADETKRDFVLISLKNVTAKSFKLTNIIFNFKDMLDTLLEIALVSSIPTSSVQAARFVLLLSYKVFCLSTKSLFEATAQVLLFLHQNNAYLHPISEDRIINYFSSLSLLTKDAVNTAVNDLLKLRCIDMVQGEITLLEKIYLK
jgi:hypothetical protein